MRVIFALLLCLAFAVQLCAQRIHTRRTDDQPNPALVQLQKQQARAHNKQRHEQLKTDADRLLQLATELKLQVDKSNENTLSVDVLRKAEQIEKLAHSVKEKMKGE